MVVDQTSKLSSQGLLLAAFVFGGSMLFTTSLYAQSGNKAAKVAKIVKEDAEEVEHAVSAFAKKHFGKQEAELGQAGFNNSSSVRSSLIKTPPSLPRARAAGLPVIVSGELNRIGQLYDEHDRNSSKPWLWGSTTGVGGGYIGADHLNLGSDDLKCSDNGLSIGAKSRDRKCRAR